jgi:DsbC/DsbD-like thiol-disulfide interchange protein
MIDRRRLVPAVLASAALISVAASSSWAGGKPASSGGKAEGPVAARLIAERGAFIPGDTTFIAIAFQLQKGWHLFWDGRNDTGAPISVRTTPPEGFRAGAILWPAPRRLVSPGRVLDHVYEGEAFLLLPVVAPKDAAAGGRATVTFELEWVACREACVVGDATVSLTLPIAEAAEALSRPEGSPDAARAFQRARARLPKALPANGAVARWRWSGETLTIESSRAKEMAFYPGAACGELVDPIADGVSASGQLALRFREVDRRVGPASGLLVLGPEGAPGVEVYTTDIPYNGNQEVR